MAIKKTVEKELSEETVIKLKPAHLYAFIAGFVGILVIIIGFFYGMLRSQDTTLDEKIKMKVDKEIYILDKTYSNNGIEDLKEMTETTLKTVQNINNDVTQIKVKVGIMEHINNSTSRPAPVQPQR